MLVRRRWLAALGVALGIVSCDAPTIPEEGFAYDPRLPGGLVYHWPTGSTISIYPDPAGWPASIDHEAAIREAFSQWEEVTYYRDYSLRLVDDPEVADVIVHHYEAPLLVDVSECTYPGAGASGVTFFCPDASRDSLQVLPLRLGGGGRVKMDVQVGAPALVTQEGFQPYVTHEIGHVLGIGAHSGNPADLLFVGDLTASAPTERDARTLRWVLRQPVDIRP